MTSRNVESVRKLLEAFCREDTVTAAGFFAVDSVLASPSGTIVGREAIEEHMRHWLAKFPNPEMRSLELLESGNAVVAVISVEAVHLGPMGDIPATGKPWSLKFCEVYRFNDEGLVARDDAFYDMLSLLQQLGLA